MSNVNTVQHALVDAIRQSSNFNPNTQVNPAVVL